MLGKCEDKERFGIHRHRQEDRTEMDVKEVPYEAVDWIDLE
jgi:hypothetical protein